MSSTHLIYVSKDKAEVNNDLDGTFLSKVDDGIIIKEGDEISIEGIAINSTGVGNDIIEVPSQVQGYNYLTNRMKFNMMVYVCHNYEVSCLLPLTTFTNKYSTITDDNYGYLSNTNPALTLASIKTSTKSKNLLENQGGKRFYLGAYSKLLPDGTINAWISPASTPAELPNAVPNMRVFSFCESDIEFGVDIGYDNPSNIANKITQDFHAAEISQQQSQLLNSGCVSQAFPNASFITPASAVSFNLTCSTYNTATTTINGLPYVNTSTSDYSWYDGILGVGNPFYCFYGSRLLNDGSVYNEGVGLKNNTYLGNSLPANAPKDTEVYVITTAIPEDPTNTYNVLPAFFVLTTNLPFTEKALNLVQGFCRSQEALYTAADGKFTTKELDDPKNAEYWVMPMAIGRYDDTAATASVPLLSPCMVGGVAASLGNVDVFTRYFEDGYTRANIGSNMIFNGCFIDDSKMVNYGGTQETAKSLVQKLNLGIVPVNTGSDFGNNEVNIGFICRGSDYGTATAPKKIGQGNFCLVDLSFFNPQNPTICLSNPESTATAPSPITALDQMARLINVGSPNFAMTFDGTRGRFGLTEMAWANIINNLGQTTTANASAGQEAIQAQSLYPDTTSFINNGAGITKTAYIKYAQSGLGIRNISVIKNDGSNESVEINPFDILDVKNKFQGSLLERLGFEYNALVNWNGIPDALFCQRTYQSVIPIANPQYFPFPLTTNLRFDTALDIGLSVNNSKYPMFNLQLGRNYTNINIQSVSDIAFATNLPQKLVFPYWLIKSDIIDGVEFNSGNGGKKQNVMAVCNRAYLSGDFAFSFSTSYAFKATKEFVLTAINTQILNPDLTAADIDPKTAIIYKVVSPIKFFENQQIAADIEAKKKSK